MVSFPMILSDP